MHRPTDRIDEYIDLRDAINALPTRQRRAIFLYSLGMTQCEIAEDMGIAQQNVSKLLTKAFENMRGV